jgi:hypothetical protein
MSNAIELWTKYSMDEIHFILKYHESSFNCFIYQKSPVRLVEQKLYSIIISCQPVLSGYRLLNIPAGTGI